MNLDELIPGVTQRLHAQTVHPEAYHKRTKPAVGIMLHYDGSAGADKWALGWFLDPRCKVGYDAMALDDGSAALIHDDIERVGSQHAGPGIPEARIPSGTLALPKGGVMKFGRSNGAYYGVSVTTGPGHPVTPRQYRCVVGICAAIYQFHIDHPTNPWPKEELGERICSHASKAIYTPKYTSNPALWGKLGRKDDPEGPDAPGLVVLSTESVIIATALLLTPPPVPSVPSLASMNDPFNHIWNRGAV